MFNHEEKLVSDKFCQTFPMEVDFVNRIFKKIEEVLDLEK